MPEVKFEKIQSARQSYWAKMTPQERSQRMRAIALKKQAGLTFKQKRAHALKMVAARRKAKKSVV